MPPRLKLSLPRGAIPTVFGCILVAPAFYNREAFDNALNYVFVGIGICLILIGLSRFGDGQPVQHAEDSEPTTIRTANLDQEVAPSSPRPLLSRTFAMLGSITVALTALGLAYMMFFAPTGSASGVGIGMGLLLAGAFYALAAMAKR